MPTIGPPSQVLNSNPYAGIKMNQEFQTPPPSRPPSAGSEGTAEILGKINGGELVHRNLYKDKENHNKMGKDEFLKLLTHQLQHQDPMKPADQAQFASDLAQFASLEQLTNIQKLIEKNGGNALAENKFYAASFLGKKIMSEGSSIDFKGGISKINFSLESAAEKCQIRIFDAQGNMVGQIEKDKLPSGPHTVDWDGTTLDGAGAGKGEYTFKIKSWDTQNNPIKAETKTAGIVSGIKFENGETVLIVNGKKVALREVESFELVEPPGAQPPPAAPRAATR